MDVLRKSISVFTDGSCHQSGIGGWAAMLLMDDQKFLLSGRELATTHQRMELTAALRAMEHLLAQNVTKDTLVSLYTDSQYLVNLPFRRERLQVSGWVTKNLHPLRNADLIRLLLENVDKLSLTFVKVKAHEKAAGSDNYNRDVDKLSRKIVRDYVKYGSVKHL
ncbi:MAG: ribonuclease H [Cyclobacteriaceae bacterium]